MKGYQIYLGGRRGSYSEAAVTFFGNGELGERGVGDTLSFDDMAMLVVSTEENLAREYKGVLPGWVKSSMLGNRYLVSRMKESGRESYTIKGKMEIPDSLFTC